METTAVYNVLIVDDEPDATAMLAKFLASRGYRTETAANGAEALEHVLADRFDVVMTDLRMPGMDGGDFLARVRFERPNLPVIVMTGYTSLDPNDALWSKAGVLRVLYKPVNLREVSALLQQLFAS